MRGDRIEWCNSTAADHLGVDPSRDVGQPLTNLVRVPAFVAHLQARKSDEPLTFAIPARRRRAGRAGCGPTEKARCC